MSRWTPERVYLMNASSLIMKMALIANDNLPDFIKEEAQQWLDGYQKEILNKKPVFNLNQSGPEIPSIPELEKYKIPKGFYRWIVEPSCTNASTGGPYTIEFRFERKEPKYAYDIPHTLLPLLDKYKGNL